jgi:hypothetical protein
MKTKYKIGAGILGILFLAFSFVTWGLPPSEEPQTYQSTNEIIVDRASGCEYLSNSEYNGELGAVYQECNRNWEQREYVRLKYINDDATNYPKETESEIMIWDGKQLSEV